MSQDRGESLKANIIMRMVMSTGAGLMIKVGAASLICPIMNPINPDMCAKITGEIWNLLIQGGIFPIGSGILGGVVVMFLSGKWKRN